MKTLLHTTIRRLGVSLVIATALFAVATSAALGRNRPLSSSYKPQDLQRMSDSWAARGGVFTNVPVSSYYTPEQIQTMSESWAARGGVLNNVPVSSYYTPQQIENMSQSWAARGGVFTDRPAASYYTPQEIENMSQSWAARGGLLPAGAKVTISRRPSGFDWGDFGIGAAAMLGLVLLAGGIVAGAHYGRRSGATARVAS
jgi:hypothetical protein